MYAYFSHNYQGFMSRRHTFALFNPEGRNIYKVLMQVFDFVNRYLIYDFSLGLQTIGVVLREHR